VKMARQPNLETVVIRFSRQAESPPTALIEWLGMNPSEHDPFRSFAGSYEIRMSLAAKAIEAHGGSATCENGSLRVKLPLSD